MIKVHKEKTRLRKEALQAMYQRCYSHNNRCVYYDDCVKDFVGYDPTHGYDSSYTAVAGDNYDLEIDGKEVRILFVGKEGTVKNDVLSPPSRLDDFRDERTGGGRVNQHYLETYRMLCEMLNYNWAHNHLADEYTVKGYVNKPDSVLTCFALTNRYRCAFKKYPGQRSEIPNGDSQTKNCLELLKDEIRSLAPTIIVLQGKPLKAGELSPVEPCGPIDKLFYSSELQAYIIETVHPCVRDGSWLKEYYPMFSRTVAFLRTKNALPSIERSTTDELNSLCR